MKSTEERTTDRAISKEGLLQRQRQLAAIKAGIARDTYLDCNEVETYLGVSRATVEGYPVEILPYWDATPLSSRTRRRYSPADVAAAPILIRRWTEAKALGRGEAYLRDLRESLRQREEQVLTKVADGRVA